MAPADAALAALSASMAASGVSPAEVPPRLLANGARRASSIVFLPAAAIDIGGPTCSRLSDLNPDRAAGRLIPSASPPVLVSGHRRVLPIIGRPERTAMAALHPWPINESMTTSS
uniref:Uncharacterized protein n=1 Tax=Leersia perrieri TaxID=77586 RepID=A0A0D9WR06_9ORYZ